MPVNGGEKLERQLINKLLLMNDNDSFWGNVQQKISLIPERQLFFCVVFRGGLRCVMPVKA
ncbi:hypothetical protein UNDKW_5912 (plasmid) [Undibacterium sp. KW1]|nr:hypothetical protein UNDKW_5912 [Undibacterium sp. KW1]